MSEQSDVWSCCSSTTATGCDPNAALLARPTGYGPVSTRTIIEPIAPWLAGQPAALSALQIDDGSDADAHWDRATLEHHLVSASCRGIGIWQGPPQQDRLHAEILRLAGENDEVQRTAVQQTAFLRQQRISCSSSSAHKLRTRSLNLCFALMARSFGSLCQPDR